VGPRCPIAFHERVIQHSATPKGDVAAAPDSAAAVRRGTANTISAPPGAPLSGMAGLACDTAPAIGTATTVTPAATTRAPASTSTREPGRSSATAAASAIRTGACTRRSPGLWCTTAAAARGGAAGARCGGALWAAETASATAVRARTAVSVRRRRQIAARRMPPPPRPPARIGGKSGTAQRGGVYGSGTAGVRAARGGEGGSEVVEGLEYTMGAPPDVGGYRP
jgi:hypothetical protein